jgi:glutathione S-transferase
MAKLKIYGVPQSRASRALWLAHELGLDFENVPIHFADGGTKTADYLEINPNGRVPAIDDDGFRLWESMAINLYLAQKYGAGKLWPETLEDQARATQWTFWVMTECEKPVLAILFNVAVLPEEKRDPKVVEKSTEELQRPFKVLEQALADSDYLLGDAFTIADLNVAAVLAWAKMARFDFTAYPNIKDWLDRCLKREAAVKARG